MYICIHIYKFMNEYISISTYICTSIYLSIYQKFGLVSWLFGVYGISTFVGYLMPNPFLNK